LKELAVVFTVPIIRLQGAKKIIEMLDNWLLCLNSIGVLSEYGV
jgi:hypothetical protein